MINFIRFFLLILHRRICIVDILNISYCDKPLAFTLNFSRTLKNHTTKSLSLGSFLIHILKKKVEIIFISTLKMFSTLGYLVTH